MSLTINNTVGGGSYATLPTTKATKLTTTTHFPHNLKHQHGLLSLTSRHTLSTHIPLATGNKFTSSRTTVDGGSSSSSSRRERRESRDREFNLNEAAAAATAFVGDYDDDGVVDNGLSFDGKPMPKIEGLEPDFWEGEKWDGLGFFVQYMWAFGVLFSLIACGVAVATYNDGATDFRETPSYKESLESRELLEGPEASDSDVFESNPTENAPALE